MSHQDFDFSLGLAWMLSARSQEAAIEITSEKYPEIWVKEIQADLHHEKSDGLVVIYNMYDCSNSFNSLGSVSINLLKVLKDALGSPDEHTYSSKELDYT